MVAVFAPLVVMLFLAWTPGIAGHEDLGRHLRLGESISTEWRVPPVNLLTYTFPDFPFINHHWLSEVLFYQLHRVAGLNGLIVVQMLLMTTALGIALLTQPPKRHRALYWLAGLAAAVMLGSRADIRPELFTFLFVALYGALFERLRRRDETWARCVVIGLGVVWVNLHIYFVFGVGMAAAFLVERCWVERQLARWRREAGWFAALVAGCCLGPNGIGGLLYPFQIFSNYGIDIVENVSPLELWETVLNPMLLVLPFFSVAVVAACLVEVFRTRARGEPPRIAAIIVALTALVAAWKMARSVPLLALTGLPVIGSALAGGPSTSAVRAPTWTTTAGLALAAVATLAIVHARLDGWYTRAFPAPVFPAPLGFDEAARYGRIRTLVERDGLHGPVLTDFNIGSLVEYEIAPQLGYVDNRPEAFPAEFWRGEYQRALAFGPDWDELRNRRQWQAIIVSLVAAPDVVTALRRRTDWVLVHVDDACVVFAHDEPGNAVLIDALGRRSLPVDRSQTELAALVARLDQAPWWQRGVLTERAVDQLYGLMLIGAGERAWKYLTPLHARYPDDRLVSELMQLAPAEGHVDDIRRVLGAHARWPTSAKQVIDWASLLVHDGNPRDALAVLRRGRWFFPLSPVLRDAVQTAPTL